MELKPRVEQREEDQECLCDAHIDERVLGPERCSPQTLDFPTLSTMALGVCSWGMLHGRAELWDIALDDP